MHIIDALTGKCERGGVEAGGKDIPTAAQSRLLKNFKILFVVAATTANIYRLRPRMVAFDFLFG